MNIRKKGKESTYLYEILVGYDKFANNQKDWIGKWVEVPYDVISSKEKLERFLLVEYTDFDVQWKMLKLLQNVPYTKEGLLLLSEGYNVFHLGIWLRIVLIIYLQRFLCLVLRNFLCQVLVEQQWF